MQKHPIGSLDITLQKYFHDKFFQSHKGYRKSVLVTDQDIKCALTNLPHIDLSLIERYFELDPIYKVPQLGGYLKDTDTELFARMVYRYGTNSYNKI